MPIIMINPINVYTYTLIVAIRRTLQITQTSNPIYQGIGILIVCLICMVIPINVYVYTLIVQPLYHVYCWRLYMILSHPNPTPYTTLAKAQENDVEFLESYPSQRKKMMKKKWLIFQVISFSSNIHFEKGSNCTYFANFQDFKESSRWLFLS